jgi:hypothetical protein
MNNLTKEDLIYGFTITPENYCKLFDVSVTKKEKYLYKAKEIAIEILWLSFLTIGIALQVSAITYFAGTFFKIGSS